MDNLQKILITIIIILGFISIVTNILRFGEDLKENIDGVKIEQNYINNLKCYNICKNVQGNSFDYCNKKCNMEEYIDNILIKKDG